MNILVHLGHPAQFHLYKFIIRNLIDDGHKVLVVSNDKDILLNLLQRSNIPHFIMLQQNKLRKNAFNTFMKLFINDLKIGYYCLKYKIDLLTGSTAEVAHVSWFLRKLSINADDDDAAVVSLYEKIAGPFIQTSLAPTVCNNGSYEKKSIKYHGYHKLAYLHPNYFQPDKKNVEKYFSLERPYFILRLSALNAYHDAGVKGINDEIVQKLIDQLLLYGNVFITSEREFNKQFEKYRLNIDIEDMHHILAFASMVICDSQTMAAEAGVLGTPFIRYNDFVGRIGYLRDLEDNYRLGFGVKTKDVNRLYQIVEELLVMSNRKEIFQERQKKMLADKIDVTAFFTWFIENYPESKKIMKGNQDYQYNFK